MLSRSAFMLFLLACTGKEAVVVECERNPLEHCLPLFEQVEQALVGSALERSL